jgi:hypothetical protein
MTVAAHLVPSAIEVPVILSEKFMHSSGGDCVERAGCPLYAIKLLNKFSDKLCRAGRMPILRNQAAEQVQRHTVQGGQDAHSTQPSC